MISVRLISAAKLRLYFKTYKHKGKKIGKKSRCAALGFLALASVSYRRRAAASLAKNGGMAAAMQR